MIEIQYLTKEFGEVQAVRDVSLVVRPGEVYALLGANGAGKTTLLRCLVGLIKPTSGAALVCGVDVARDPRTVQRQLGFLAANMGVYPRLTVREFLAYHAALRGLAVETARTEIEALLAQFGMASMGDRRCGTLSTGQRQRVQLARALLHDPPVLVFDEPSLGLDILASAEMWQCLASARARGRAVLLSTHDLAEVELLADRVGVVTGGELVAEGTVSELLARTSAPTLTRAFLQLAGSQDLDPDTAHDVVGVA